MKKHLLISGTGRAGTTALTIFLHKLGIKTSPGNIDTLSKAGWETRLSPNAPYLIKSPFLCDELNKNLLKDVIVDGLIVPIRDLYSAAESRRHIQRLSKSDKPVPGGLWCATCAPGEQENILAKKLYNLIYSATKLGISPTFIDFDRMIEDSQYLWEKLIPFLPDNITKLKFVETHQEHFKQELRHIFIDIHIIIRFNLKMFDHSNKIYVNEEWLKERIRLFEENLSSLKNQEDQNFKIVTLFSDESPEWLRSKATDWETLHSNFIPLFVDIIALDHSDKFDEKLKIAYSKNNKLKNLSGDFLTLWHDSDDILHSKVISELRHSLREYNVKTGDILYFGKGLHLDIEDINKNYGGDYFRLFIDNKLVKTSIYNPGDQTTCMALKSNFIEFKTIYSKSHTFWREYTKIHNVNTDIRFAKIIHDNAIVNKCKYKTNIYRSNLINWVIDSKKYNTYLEIGLGDEINFNNIVIKNKTGIDIEKKKSKDTIKISSNDFFKNNSKKYDCIFIDGDHTEAQFLKDVENSLEALSDNGIILVHDINPWSEEVQRVPRETKAWTGDVWRGWVKLRRRSDINLFAIQAESGIGIIQKQKNLSPLNIEMPDVIDWEFFDQNRVELLNLKPKIWFEYLIKNDFAICKTDHVAKFVSAVKEFNSDVKSCLVGTAEYFAIKNYRPELIDQYSIIVAHHLPTAIALY